MKSFKTVPNHAHKVRLPWEVANAQYFTNFQENGGLVTDFEFSLIRKASQIPTSVIVHSSHVSKHDQNFTLDGGVVDILKQKNTDNIIPFFLTNLLDNNIDNRPIFTGNRGLKKSTFFDDHRSELEQYQSIHAVVSSDVNNNDETQADTVVSRTIVEVSKNPETQLDEPKVKDNLTVVFADNLQIDSSIGKDLLDIYGIVDKALRDSYDYLSKFRFDPEYSQKLETAFGNNFNREVADKLFDNFAEGNFTNIPTIKIVNRAAIHGGNGAFSTDTGLVYLAVEFLTENYNNTPKITDILLEETGHFVDSQINEIDAPGDEGDIFSELVLGNTLTNEELQALKTENDIITVIRNGQEVTTIRNNGSITLENNNTNILRVATWNIYGGNSINANPSTFEGRLKAISQLGSSNNIDVIVLQEVLTSKLNNSTERDLRDIINQATLNKYDIKYVANEYSQTDSKLWYSTTNTGYLVLYNKSTTKAGEIGFYQPGNDAWKSGYQVTYQSGVDGNNQPITITGDVYYRPPVKLDITKNGRTYNLFTWHNEAVGKQKDEWSVPGKIPASNASIAALTAFNDLVKNDASINKNSMVLLGDLNVSSRELARQSLFDNNTLEAFNMNKKGQANDFIFAGSSQNIQPYNIPYTLKSDAHYPVFADIFPDNSNIDNTIGKKRNADEFNTGKTQIKKGKYFNPGSTTTSSTSSSLADSTNTQIISWEKQLLYLGDNTDNVFNPLIIVDGGKVEVSKDINGKEWIYVKKDDSLNNPNNPKIYAAQGNNGDSPLFVGEMKLDPDKLAATITDLGKDSDPDYTIGGFEVKLIDLAFVDDHLEMQGSVTLPQELGGLEVAVKVDPETGSNNKILLGIPGSEIKPSGQNTTITLGDYGVTVTGGSLKLPGTKKFNALGLIEIQTTNAALDFNFQESEATITGEFIVPSLKDATLSLTEGNYIKVKKVNDALEFAMAADFSRNDIDIYGDWKLKNINVKVEKTYDNLSNKVDGTARLYTSSNNYIGLGLAFENGRLKQVSASSPEGTDFTFLGTEIDIRAIKFVSDRNPTDDNYWDPKFTLTDGYITLPELLGKNDQGQRIQVELQNLEITKDGFSLGGAIVSLPDFSVNLLGLPKLKANGTVIKLEYAKDPNKTVTNSSGQTVAEEYFKIQGKLVLPNFYTLTADFSGSNYIKISNNRDNPVEVVGTFSASNINIAPGWTIKYAELGINTTNKRVTAIGTLTIPSGIDVEAGVTFQDGVLTYAHIEAQHINKPIGTTGAYLQTIGGEYKGGDIPAFTGDVVITAGAEINLNLPSWAGGNKRVSLVELNASAKITSSNLTTKGSITVLGGLMKGSGDAEVNWDKGYLSASSNFNILDGLITTQTQFLTTSNLDLYMFGEAKVKIPDHVPFLRGTNLGSGEVYVEYTNDGNSSNDYVAAWGNTWWGSTLGIKVSFDGNWHVINSQEAKTIAQYATTKINDLHRSLDAPANKEPQHQIGDKIKDTPVISGKNINGTDGDDILHGENTHDTIYGLKGHDLLFGEGGNDTLSGDDGEDMLYGGTGNDYLYGHSDNDYLNGDIGNDVLYGGTGNDYLDGGAGDDVLYGDGHLKVTNNDHSGIGSLRQAIIDAANTPGRDTIDLTGVTGEIKLKSSLPTLNIGNDINFVDDGNTIINGQGSYQIITVNGANVSFSGLRFTKGYAKGGDGINGGGGGLGAGGALFINQGNVTLNNVNFTENKAQGGKATGNAGTGARSHILEWTSSKPAANSGSLIVPYTYYYPLFGREYYYMIMTNRGDSGNGGVGGGFNVTSFSNNSSGGSGGSGGSYGLWAWHPHTWDKDKRSNGTIGGSGSGSNDNFGQGGGGGGGGGAGGYYFDLWNAENYLNAAGGGGAGGAGGFGGGGGGAAGRVRYINYADNEKAYGAGARGGSGGSSSSFGGSGTSGNSSTYVTDTSWASSTGGQLGGQGGGGAGLGGAIFVNTGASLSLVNSTFNNNTAAGGTGANNVQGQGVGGNIFVRDGAKTQAWGGNYSNNYRGAITGLPYSIYNEIINANTLSNDDWLHGGDGNDRLFGGDGNDQLYGGDGNDRLFGGDGDDILDAGDSVLDYLNFLNPNDYLLGGAGNDTYIVDSTTDIIVENANEGTDTIESSVTYSIAALANIENLTLTGTAAINGTGNADHNIITGNAGANILSGGASNDYLLGGDGNDTLYGDDGYDDLFGDDGNDYLFGGASNDYLLGGDGDDYLLGGDGDDYLLGGDGDDYLFGGAGNDRLYGGAGDDTYIVDSTTDRIWENANRGTDTVKSSVTFSLANWANIENLTLTGTAAINGTGNAANNIITGNTRNNILDGGTGNDTLNGGAGIDTLIGGLGNDIYIVDSTTDTITELAHEGTDTIESSVTYSIAALANVENLTLTGTAAINGTGNAANNVIRGNAGANILNGLDGNDYLYGDDGNDYLYGGAGNDTYYFDADSQLGTDVIGEHSIALKTFHNRYLRAGNDDIYNDNWLVDQRTSINTWETFEVIPTIDGKVALKTFHDRYLRAGNSAENWLVDQRESINTLETFEVIPTTDGKVALKTFHDRYLRAGNSTENWLVNQNRTMLTWEAFTPISRNFDTDTLDFSQTTSQSINVNLSLHTQQTINSNLSLILDSALGIDIENVVGGNQQDQIRGNHLNNNLFGGGGNDWIESYDGEDRLYGGDGEDTLYGGRGNDFHDGGSGNDLLVGDAGLDVLTGGSGADRFFFRSLSYVDAVDKITDFNISEGDKIQIGKSGFGGITNTDNFNFNTSNGALSFGSRQFATLENFSNLQGFNISTDIVLV
jgi:Ca2+-binding RTX toxin-like protein